MTEALRDRADARLETAVADAGVRDPRPFYRPALKHLRGRDAGAFARALAHYEEELVPAVAGDGDPLAAWLRYGRLLAAELGPGRTVVVDGTGRAVDVTGDGEAGAGALLLHLPDAEEAPALVLRCPRDASAAQLATVELLAMGRVTASAYD